MSTERTVVVAGAGPTGLLIALGLGRRGMDVLVLERDDGVNRSPRALTYMPVVLEALNEFGVLEAARKVAHQCGRVKWRYQDNGAQLEVDVAALGDSTPFPFNLHMGQDRLVEILLAELATLPNVQIHWGTTVESFSQERDIVRLTTSRGGISESWTARWLVGADGARSTVRSVAGIEFEGFTWPDRYMATNLHFDFSTKGYGDAIFLIDPTNWALICRVDRGPLWRVTYGEGGETSDEDALGNVRARLEYFTGSAKFELVHASPYRVHERAASTFRQSRVLLAGDAAHAVNPLGGQGLTAGILDARELVHVLGGVISGSYPDQALDFYATERRRAVTEISMNFSKGTKRLVQEPDAAVRRKDEAFLREATLDPAVMRQRMQAMMAVRGRSYSPTEN